MGSGRDTRLDLNLGLVPALHVQTLNVPMEPTTSWLHVLLIQC